MKWGKRVLPVVFSNFFFLLPTNFCFPNLVPCPLYVFFLFVRMTGFQVWFPFFFFSRGNHGKDLKRRKTIKVCLSGQILCSLNIIPSFGFPIHWPNGRGDIPDLVLNFCFLSPLEIVIEVLKSRTEIELKGG